MESTIWMRRLMIVTTTTSTTVFRHTTNAAAVSIPPAFSSSKQSPRPLLSPIFHRRRRSFSTSPASQTMHNQSFSFLGVENGGINCKDSQKVILKGMRYQEFQLNRFHHPQLSAPAAVFKRQFPTLLLNKSSSSSSVNLPKLKEQIEEEVEEIRIIKHKVDSIGINFDSCTRGHYTYRICPSCKGGQNKERSLSFHVNQNENVAIWRCFNFECGWAGHVLADVGPTQDEVNKLKLSKKPSEETLWLEPLGDELIKYFAERMISVDTLQKNAVMQMVDDKNVIAYTYRRKGELVNCKFRSITSRKFWQAKHGERIFYGLDDIQEGNDIVIVEGEIDKLSMEEAGILNCVSVPDGAPQHVSTKVSPYKKQNSRFKYLSDCNSYLDKAPRIILATDGDGPGQALAEELSSRLGKERCWRVTWPKKDENSCYKDANEVLVHLGVEELRQIVETAELYQVKNSL